LFIILFSICFPIRSFGQETNLSETIVNIAEELAADDTDPEAAANYIERLLELEENPVHLNSADENQISRLFFLSDFQIKSLADYVRSSGRIISVFEIANIPGFDKETAEMMNPLISLSGDFIRISDSSRWRNTLISNFSIRSGKNDTSYLGSMWKILTKYKFTAGGFSGGFTVEKDPGEKFFTGTPPLPDFLSAHIAYNGSGLIRRVIIGDYAARFGQGTNINTGIRTGLSLTVPGYMAARDEIKPYTSSDENNFFRGVAAEFGFKNLGFTLFYSRKYSDATIASSSDSINEYIENFYLAGIHNTPSLLLKKDAISESAYGLNLSYSFNNIRIGLVYSANRFSLPVITASGNPENIFDFEGDRNNLYTFYYNCLIKRILLYGEFSANDNFNYAYIQGLSFRPSDRLTLNFLLRNYNSGYTSFHGRGPGSGSINSIEQGILGNFTFEAAKHLFISGGCDIQNFQWLRYRCSSPSWGIRKEIKIRYLPTEKLTVEASYNYRLSIVDNTGTSGIPDQKQIVTKSIKGSFRYSPNENFILGTRIDFKLADPSGSKGMLFLEDISYRFRSIPVLIWFRYCIFTTDDYESRLYTFENDLLYSLSIPALFGKGSRAYLMTGWKITDNAELRIKYAISTKSLNSVSVTNTEEFRIQIKITI
jgi:hypothetical protein